MAISREVGKKGVYWFVNIQKSQTEKSRSRQSFEKIISHKTLMIMMTTVSWGGNITISKQKLLTQLILIVFCVLFVETICTHEFFSESYILNSSTYVSIRKHFHFPLFDSFFFAPPVYCLLLAKTLWDGTNLFLFGFDVRTYPVTTTSSCLVLHA